MFSDILVLAQEGSALFNLRNLVLVLIIVGILVGYKMWKNKTMS